jgi:hypothetical protein
MRVSEVAGGKQKRKNRAASTKTDFERNVTKLKSKRRRFDSEKP